MAPVITLIGHAKGLHNLHQDWSICDPMLTYLGVCQCQAVCDEVPKDHPHQGLAIVSHGHDLRALFLASHRTRHPNHGHARGYRQRAQCVQ
jgi:hypothetical protein